jgi:hypothetical protein
MKDWLKKYAGKEENGVHERQNGAPPQHTKLGNLGFFATPLQSNLI